MLSADAIKFKTAVLLQSPLTLKSCGAPVWEPSPNLKGSPAHRKLFREYAQEIDIVAQLASEWWEDTVDAERGEGVGKKEAVRAAWECRPAGPASFPGVVAIVRDFWLQSHELNQDAAENQRVPPWTFLLSWLQTGDHELAVSVLASMPYWPIGLDEDGNWV